MSRSRSTGENGLRADLPFPILSLFSPCRQVLTFTSIRYGVGTLAVFLFFDRAVICRSLHKEDRMRLDDLMPIQGWEALERELHERSGLNACTYDPEGSRITAFSAWANDICPQVKASPQGVAAICAVANQFFTNQARETGQRVIGECDGGLAKFALPIVHQGQFLGTIGGCGHRFPDGEVETFLIHKSTGLKMEDLEQLCTGVRTITRQDVEELAGWLQLRLDEVLLRGSA